MKFLRVVEVLMCCTSFVACIVGAHFGYQMYLRNEELDAKVESQHAKIVRLSEDLKQHNEEAAQQCDELADRVARVPSGVAVLPAEPKAGTAEI